MDMINSQTFILSKFIDYLLGAVVGVVFPLLIKYFINYFQLKRPTQKMWGTLLHKKQKLTLITTSLNTSEIKTYTAVPSAEFAALINLSTELKRVYKSFDFEYYPSGKFQYRKLGENLLVVGGPRNNEVARRFFKLPNLPIRFNDHEIIDNNMKCYSPHFEEQILIKDYGVIVKSPNPFDDNNNYILLLAGCHAYGTNAAIRALTLPLLKETLRHVSSKKAFAIIVEAHIVDEFVSNPKIVKTIELSQPLSLSPDSELSALEPSVMR